MTESAVDRLGRLGVREVTEHDDPMMAVERLIALYDGSIARMQAAVQQAGAPDKRDLGECHGYYPVIGFSVPKGRLVPPEDQLAYGYCRNGPGLYTTSITRPGMFRDYLGEQLTLLRKNHGSPIVVGIGPDAIPLDFAIQGSIREVSPEVRAQFAGVDLNRIQDFKFAALEGTYPLALYSAMRTDYSVTRWAHYTGTKPEDLQRFVLVTNYEMFGTVFQEWAQSMVGKDGYTEFFEPEALKHGSGAFKRPQMPAMHLKRADGNGISIVNIGVGPSNAKTMMDLLAVFRPHIALMVGHCAGTRATQNLGHLILADGYYRRDGVMDHLLPLDIPIVPLTEPNHCLRMAAREVLSKEKAELRAILETGTVASECDRHWEINDTVREAIRKSRAVAVDMESGTVAAAGFWHRVPYATLLRVSDMPTQGEVKLQGAAWQFYQDTVVHHLHIAIRAVEMMREIISTLHSRKLREPNDAPFR